MLLGGSFYTLLTNRVGDDMMLGITEFCKQLQLYIRFAFDNEQLFFERFFPENCGNMTELTEVYMASGMVRIEYHTYESRDIHTVISTTDFIDWYNKYNSGK